MSPGATRALVAACALLVLSPLRPASADTVTAPALEERRAALLAYGVAPSDAAMELGASATARCARSPEGVACAIAEAAYDLAAARTALAAAERLAAERGGRRIRLEGSAGLSAARVRLPALASRLDRAIERAQRATGPEARAAATLVRLLEELLRTRGSTEATLAALTPDATSSNAAAEAAALAEAQSLVDRAIAESRDADDAYLARRRSSGERQRAQDRVAAAGVMLRSIPRRIAELPEAERAGPTASYEAAVALADFEARFEALFDLAAEVEVRVARMRR